MFPHWGKADLLVMRKTPKLVTGLKDDKTGDEEGVNPTPIYNQNPSGIQGDEGAVIEMKTPAYSCSYPIHWRFYRQSRLVFKLGLSTKA